MWQVVADEGRAVAPPDQDIIPVYVEATADETEAQLLTGLKKRLPALPAELDLTADPHRPPPGAGQGQD